MLGLLAGFIGSKIVNNRGEGVAIDIVLEIVGAAIEEWLFSTFGGSDVTGLNLYSLLVAVIGAVVVLLVYHANRPAILLLTGGGIRCITYRSRTSLHAGKGIENQFHAA